MSLRRILALLYREAVQGPKNFIFIFTIVVPLGLSLALGLIFGTFFSGKPRLGIVDPGASRLTQLAEAMPGLMVRRYASEAEVRDATANGAVDVGLLVSADFDQRVLSGQHGSLTVYVWGESLLRDRVLIGTAIADWLRELAGHEPPVTIATTMLGANNELTWQQRLLPLLVLMTVVFGALMLPASSLVSEKQRRTLNALLVTPATRAEIYVAKGVLGVALSTVMALLVLALNGAWSSQIWLVLLVLFLGAVLSAEFGILLGVLVNDINSLFATVKALGLLLYAPALIGLFPMIPQWIAQFFPTFYMVDPVISIVQRGATLSDIAGQLAVLAVMIVALAGVLRAAPTVRLTV
ncbi:ABC transporter permease [uncultured Chloroflexus sp.]|uniref:ABC transporter permease n=1 Tax=uncultured Chloroflexus sp. TaxID=214040 RepID=UPI00261410DE|nr:ABC transporter permease [uncultured Chloroflexus sp.]